MQNLESKQDKNLQKSNRIAFQVNPNQKVDFLMQLMADYNSKMSPLFVKKILEEVGFETTDQETYQLIGILTDKFLDEMVAQIHKNKSSGDKNKKEKKRDPDQEYFKTSDLFFYLRQQGMNIEEVLLQPSHCQEANPFE